MSNGNGNGNGNGNNEETPPLIEALEPGMQARLANGKKVQRSIENNGDWDIFYVGSDGNRIGSILGNEYLSTDYEVLPVGGVPWAPTSNVKGFVVSGTDNTVSAADDTHITAYRTEDIATDAVRERILTTTVRNMAGFSKSIFEGAFCINLNKVAGEFQVRQEKNKTPRTMPFEFAFQTSVQAENAAVVANNVLLQKWPK